MYEGAAIEILLL